MYRRPIFNLLLLLVLALSASPADARPPAPGPGVVPRPKKERTDAELFAKAMRIQGRMWPHISREGMLVYVHRQNATPDQLSHDALKLADAAIWTGCYAASQACRWHVTRDPEALAQTRVLARGLALLSDATGAPGALARNVGRRLPGEPLPKRCVASPTYPGLYIRSDVSRDQLAGVVLGWMAIYRYVEDGELRELARRQMKAIANRIYRHDMHLRDYRGKETEHGDLDKDADPLGLVQNGQSAAIAYATFVVAAHVGSCDRCNYMCRKLQKEGWRDALLSQHIGIKQHLSASNVNMTNLALLAIRLGGQDDRSRRYAKDAMRKLRRATVGWWNGGFCACQMLAGLNRGRRDMRDELRVCLHVMSEDEIPPRDVRERVIRRPATLRERGNSHWAWKSLANRTRVPVPGSPPHPTVIHTRGDWLFAYWLARAAGELRPKTGPGAQTVPVLLGVEAPAWARDVDLPTGAGR